MEAIITTALGCPAHVRALRASHVPPVCYYLKKTHVMLLFKKNARSSGMLLFKCKCLPSDLRSKEMKEMRKEMKEMRKGEVFKCKCLPSDLISFHVHVLCMYLLLNIMLYVCNMCTHPPPTSPPSHPPTHPPTSVYPACAIGMCERVCAFVCMRIRRLSCLVLARQNKRCQRRGIPQTQQRSNRARALVCDCPVLALGHS